MQPAKPAKWYVRVADLLCEHPDVARAKEEIDVVAGFILTKHDLENSRGARASRVLCRVGAIKAIERMI